MSNKRSHEVWAFYNQHLNKQVQNATISHFFHPASLPLTLSDMLANWIASFVYVFNNANLL